MPDQTGDSPKLAYICSFASQLQLIIFKISTETSNRSVLANFI